MKERKKFYTGKTKSEFPINQFRYDTTNHPIINGPCKGRGSQRLVLSRTESQYLDFISNALQAPTGVSQRICVYEVLRRDKVPPKEITDLASRFTTHRNHKTRNKKADFKAPKHELLLIKLKAESWSMTEQELVRSCLLHVVSEVRSESRFRFDKCKRIPVDELAHAHRETYQEKKKGKLQALREAHMESYDEAKELGELSDREDYEARGELLDQLNAEGLGFEVGFQALLEGREPDKKEIKAYLDEAVRVEADLRERELLETEEGRDLLIGQMLIDGLSQEDAEQIVRIMAATKDRFEAEDDWYDYDF